MSVAINRCIFSGLRDSRHPDRSPPDCLVESAGLCEPPRPTDDQPAGGKGSVQLKQQPERRRRRGEEEGQEEEQEEEEEEKTKGESSLKWCSCIHYCTRQKADIRR